MCLFLIHVVGTIPKIKKDRVAKTLAFMPGFIMAKIYSDNDDDNDDEDDEEDEDPSFLKSRPHVLHQEEDNDDDKGAGMAPVVGAAQPVIVH